MPRGEADRRPARGDHGGDDGPPQGHRPQDDGRRGGLLRRWSGGKKFREKGISLPKDNEVSTTHAKIELKNDQIVLVDVGSTNGTSVDGEPIEEGKPHPLAAGNTVVFGASTFTVSEIKAA